MKWSGKEIEYLKESYGYRCKEDLINNIDHPWNSIEMKASELNLTKDYVFWTEKDIKYLKNNYKFRNKEDIINNINHTWASIKQKASELNLTGISIDEDFFKYWTKDMAWIFGFWVADGNMRKNKDEISFKSKDYNLLEIIRSNLKSGHKIGKNNNIFRLSICNKTMYNDLLKLGGIQRKSLTIQFPKVPDKFLSHFIRGEFDGDGCNYIYKNEKYRYLMSSFVGNVDFLTGLKDKIREHVNIETGLYSCGKNCNPRIKQLRYNGKKALVLGDYIYQDSENLRLERKFKIYDQMKKEYLKKL